MFADVTIKTLVINCNNMMVKNGMSFVQVHTIFSFLFTLKTSNTFTQNPKIAITVSGLFDRFG